MSTDDQLLYESRVRNRQAIVAVLAGVLLIVASVVQLGGQHTSVSELTLDLLIANKRFPLDLIASTINALASIAMAWTLVFLYRCSKARNPTIRPFIAILTMTGGGLAAVAGIVYAVIVAIKVHQFATTGAQTYDEASRLTGGAGLVVLQLLGEFAALLIAISFVLVCMQAMRVGLLTKFMGYLGMFAGALVLFQITQVPVVQLFWLASVGFLISGRWPSGIPAAWRTGHAEVLPSGAELRAQRMAAGGGRPGAGGASRARNGASGAPPAGGLTGWLAGRSRSAPPADSGNGSDRASAAGETGAGAGGPDPRTRAGTPKRKRKRRR